MKSFVIFIQRTILWLVSLVVSAFIGFVGGAIYQEHKEAEAEKDAAEKKAKDEETLSRLRAEREDKGVTVRFDSKAKNWMENLEGNTLLVRTVQDFANERLKKNGHVFLNEVYDELGLRRTHYGQVAGWNNGHIAIAVSNPDDRGNVDLTFNIDGEIHDDTKTWAKLWPES